MKSLEVVSHVVTLLTLVVALLTLWLLVGAGVGEEPQRSADGWTMSHVVATRYENPMMGFHIGFLFPKNCNDYDSEDVFEWFRQYDGWVFQGGGQPCGPMYVVFRDVKDPQAADMKLKKILPALNAYMRAHK